MKTTLRPRVEGSGSFGGVGGGLSNTLTGGGGWGGGGVLLEELKGKAIKHSICSGH